MKLVEWGKEGGQVGKRKKGMKEGRKKCQKTKGKTKIKSRLFNDVSPSLDIIYETKRRVSDGRIRSNIQTTRMLFVLVNLSSIDSKQNRCPWMVMKPFCSYGDHSSSFPVCLSLCSFDPHCCSFGSSYSHCLSPFLFFD